MREVVAHELHKHFFPSSTIYGTAAPVFASSLLTVHSLLVTTLAGAAAVALFGEVLREANALSTTLDAL